MLYNKNEGVSKCKFRHTLLSCVRVSKMQGAEIEDDGSVLKYTTKSDIEEQRSSLLIITQRHFFVSNLSFKPNYGSALSVSTALHVLHAYTTRAHSSRSIQR